MPHDDPASRVGDSKHEPLEYERWMTLYCPECEKTYDGDEYELCPLDGSRLFQLNAPTDKGDPLLGTIVDDRFRIVELLGAGGMGAVYRGTQLSVGREVAIKVLRPELADREMMLERFFREAKVVSELTHPNIVRLVEFGQDQSLDLLYLVMELVRGTDLGDLLREGRLRTNLALEVVYQVCGALTEPHAQGIVHRDLKPENLVMMPISDGTLQVKVLDFGIARALERGTQLTKTGMVCGTPSYMAPEQAQNESLDGRTDLYALGVLLYEMLTGQPPFLGESSLQVLLKHIQRPAPRLDEVTPAGTVPEEVSDLVARLLAKSPQHRPGSARVVRDEIDEIRHQLQLSPVRLDASDAAPFDAWVMPRLENMDISRDPVRDSSASDLPVGLDKMSTGESDAAPRSTDEFESKKTGIRKEGGVAKEQIGVAETLASTPSQATPAVSSTDEKKQPQAQRAEVNKASTEIVTSPAGEKSPAGRDETSTAKTSEIGAPTSKIFGVLVAVAVVGVLSMVVVAGVLVYQVVGQNEEDPQPSVVAEAEEAEDDDEEAATPETADQASSAPLEQAIGEADQEVTQGLRTARTVARALAAEAEAGQDERSAQEIISERRRATGASRSSDGGGRRDESTPATSTKPPTSPDNGDERPDQPDRSANEEDHSLSEESEDVRDDDRPSELEERLRRLRRE